ncbi:MAG: heavy metal translocating P-type ATPase [Candidatus Marsarchaeota archaeon]|jgi:Cu+-exporting ATPase|nr:heavy metal translocating P-type ATPase [Candidatus Marsarchaeota archaeon]
MATDPICGMSVDEKSSSLFIEQQGRKYYFCSTTCKIQFEKPEKELKALKHALLVAVPLTIIVFVLTYASKDTLVPYVLFIIATVVQFYSGERFYAGIVDAIKNRSSNMDTLIAIGTTAAWAYSTTVVFMPSAFPTNSLYFDTSTIIISLILAGTYLQRMAESKASNSIASLMKLQPKKAHLIKGNSIIEKPIDEIKKGDILLVKPGENIPTDSMVVNGSSSIDESMITGESMSVAKRKGDHVTGGTVNLTSSVQIKVEKVGEDTMLAQIINIVQEAASSKVPIQKLADKVSSYFVPTVIVIGILSSVGWYLFGGVGLNIAVLIFVSVLIIACPCALGIATPAALLVSSGMAAKNGILVKSGESLQEASRIDAVVLDKTGTLTEGKPSVIDVIGMSGFTYDKVLVLAAMAESNSEHIIGKAVVKKANERNLKIEFPKKFNYTIGSGVTASGKDGTVVTVGNTDMFKGKFTKAMWELVLKLEQEGKSCLIVGVNGEIAGIISIADKLKKDSKQTIQAFNKSGKEVWMITGDNNRVASSISKELGIKNFISGAKPKDKLKKINDLQKHGKHVAMIGDGINDAPALTKADLGIALGSGSDIAMQSGDVVLIKNRIYDAYISIELGRKTMAKIRQNLAWAFGYNAVLIPIAAGALIPLYTINVYNFLPMFSGLAMAFSSVTVVSNSLLLGRFKIAN